MKSAKSILTGTGAVVLAGLILALLAPKAAHAIAATAVQVENTIASPVPTQAILPGQLFVQTCTVGGPPSLISCTLTPPVPSPFIFHITQQVVHADLGNLAAGATPPTSALVSWSYLSNGTTIALAEYAQGANSAPALVNVTNHDWYMDAGGQAVCSASIPGSGPGLQCTVTGYLTH
jgi:hypothetical protein